MCDNSGVDAQYLTLATFRRDGSEVRTPVWFAEVDGKRYVFTAGSSGKVKRLHRSPRARIAACDARGRVEGDWHAATARIVGDAMTIERARRAMHAKYGWRLTLLDLLSRLSGRIHRRAWIEIET